MPILLAHEVQSVATTVAVTVTLEDLMVRGAAQRGVPLREWCTNGSQIATLVAPSSVRAPTASLLLLETP